jgi:hypothetical protein
MDSSYQQRQVFIGQIQLVIVHKHANFSQQ